jgi:hypothetical protein
MVRGRLVLLFPRLFCVLEVDGEQVGLFLEHTTIKSAYVNCEGVVLMVSARIRHHSVVVEDSVNEIGNVGVHPILLD